jgi:hypothetical protein
VAPPAHVSVASQARDAVMIKAGGRRDPAHAG